MNCQNIRELMNGYLDGELDLVNHLEIERHLNDCDACAKEYKNFQTLRSSLDESFYFHAPANLRKNIRSALRQTDGEPTRYRFWHWRWLAAATSVAAIVILTLVFLRTGSTGDEVLASEIVSNHVRSMMVNHLTDVPSTDQHTVKPWFQDKLDFSPPVVDLTSQGYTLIGGRLDYAANRPVAALVYQRRQHFINLFVFPSSGVSDSGDKMLARQGYNIIHWNKSGMSFWAVSDLNLSELQEFAEGIQR